MSRNVDPIVTEIIRNGLVAATEEMKTNLMRTAYNMIIYEALDFTVGLFTAEGETVSIGLGLPMFIRGMSETIKAKLKQFGANGLAPGDILVTNDAYLTGSHLNHFTFSLPIFHQGKLSGFACCMAHWPDVGGALDGVTTDIYSEGLQIPIVKYQRSGIVNQDLVEILRMNVRLPERAMGDLRAQITALAEGVRGSITRRLLEREVFTPAARPPLFGLGFKELWDVPVGRFPAGGVRHTFGYPLYRRRGGLFGGGPPLYGECEPQADPGN